MVKIVSQKDRELYQCQEYGLKYKDKEWAEKCELWCRKNNSCNLEIISHAVEKVENI